MPSDRQQVIASRAVGMMSAPNKVLLSLRRAGGGNKITTSGCTARELRSLSSTIQLYYMN